MRVTSKRIAESIRFSDFRSDLERDLIADRAEMFVKLAAVERKLCVFHERVKDGCYICIARRTILDILEERP